MPTPSTPRPPLPALGLPAPPPRLGPGALLALAVHLVLIGALVWERAHYLQGALGGEGPQGGGGGGGGELMRYVALPPAAAAPPAAAPQPAPETPVPQPLAVPVPEPLKIEIAPVTITPTPVTVSGVGPGTGGGPGQLAGSGGGTGTGTGTGAGSHEGPGSGGDGGYILPVLRGLIIAPDCVRGQFTVLFSVAADGRVVRVDVNPLPKDGACRRDLVTRMQQYKFDPARTPDGRNVASTYKVTIEH